MKPWETLESEMVDLDFLTVFLIYKKNWVSPQTTPNRTNLLSLQAKDPELEVSWYESEVCVGETSVHSESLTRLYGVTYLFL